MVGLPILFYKKSMNKLLSKGLYALLALAIVFGAMSSCSGCSNKERTVELPPVANKEDSVRLFTQANAFMETMKSGDLNTAIDMLWVIGDNDTAYHITDSLKEVYKKQFTLFPVKEYEVITSDFTVPNRQTINFRYRFMDNPTDDPNYPVYTNFGLAMEYHQGDWRLILNNQHIIP